jgi:predicted membrane protein|tara:strand:- start:8 stop:367 length:360 start_codon:yes stop_codon:yes gene_type:complete
MNPIKNIVFWLIGLLMVAVGIPEAWEKYGDIKVIAFEGAIMMVGWLVIWVIGAGVFNFFLYYSKKNKIEKIRNKKTVKEEKNDIEDKGLMSKVKRLKSLYNNGTLNKDEFEKAKNKLLK